MRTKAELLNKLNKLPYKRELEKVLKITNVSNFVSWIEEAIESWEKYNRTMDIADYDKALELHERAWRWLRDLSDEEQDEVLCTLPDISFLALTTPIHWRKEDMIRAGEEIKMFADGLDGSSVVSMKVIWDRIIRNIRTAIREFERYGFGERAEVARSRASALYATLLVPEMERFRERFPGIHYLIDVPTVYWSPKSIGEAFREISIWELRPKVEPEIPPGTIETITMCDDVFVYVDGALFMRRRYGDAPIIDLWRNKAGVRYGALTKKERDLFADRFPNTRWLIVHPSRVWTKEYIDKFKEEKEDWKGFPKLEEKK